MRARTLLLALLFTSALPGVVPVARAQSLADVARKEAERRKEVKEPRKTFTNDDLPNSPPSANANPASPPPSDAVAPATPAEKPADDASKDGSGAKDEKYWSTRIKALRAALENDHVLVDAVQSRVNALTTDFVNRDDPAQRAVIAAEPAEGARRAAIACRQADRRPTRRPSPTSRKKRAAPAFRPAGCG